MSDSDSNTVDHKRRRMLVAGTAGVGVVGAAAFAAPLLASWMPSARAKAAGAPVEVNISKIEDGQLVRVIWRGKPVWLIKRSPETLADLASNEELLADPSSSAPQQPSYATNEARSIKPEMMIAIGICTHLGCSPTYIPEIGSASSMGANWQGGFFCPCHGSSFDMAGRVFKNVPAPTNLLVPPHFYKSDDLVLIGEDGGSA